MLNDNIDLQQIIESYNPKKISLLKNIAVLKIYDDLFLQFGTQFNFNLNEFIDKNKEEFNKIEIDHKLFNQNYHSLNESLNEGIKTKYDKHFENSNELMRNLFDFYKFWYVYLKDGELQHFYEIIETADDSNQGFSFTTIFGEFRNFYNLMTGRIEELDGGKKITGGFSLQKIVLSIFVLLFIIPLHILFPKEEGVHALVSTIRFIQSIKDLPPKISQIPEIITKYHINDDQFNMFLDGCENLMKTINVISDYTMNKKNEIYKKIHKKISRALSGIKIGRTIMNIGKNVEKLLHNSNNSHIQNDDEKFDVKNLTPAQLNELLILNQLSPREFLSLSNSQIWVQLITQDPIRIDGGYKKRKTERKRIGKKKRKTERKRFGKKKRKTERKRFGKKKRKTERKRFGKKKRKTERKNSL
jgi:hypothetical protein